MTHFGHSVVVCGLQAWHVHTQNRRGVFRWWVKGGWYYDLLPAFHIVIGLSIILIPLCNVRHAFGVFFAETSNSFAWCGDRLYGVYSSRSIRRCSKKDYWWWCQLLFIKIT